MQHPAAVRPVRDFLERTRVTLLNEIPTSDHLAIVGNSSVAVELIALGIPVYQVFGFDPIERDYNGFVEEGLIFEATLSQLSGRFWTPYIADASWRAVLSEWLPDIQACEADIAAFQKAMAAIYGHNRTILDKDSIKRSKAR